MLQTNLSRKCAYPYCYNVYGHISNSKLQSQNQSKLQSQDQNKFQKKNNKSDDGNKSPFSIKEEDDDESESSPNFIDNIIDNIIENITKKDKSDTISCSSESKSTENT